MASAAALLRRLGFQQILPKNSVEAWHRRRKESQWRAPNGLCLELHSRLADSADLIPSIDVRSPRQNVEINPGLVLPTLAIERLFAYLCVHGASSNWFRLKWITDLAALIDRCASGEVEHLYARSQELGAGRADAQALLLAEHLYGTARGSPIIDELQSHPQNRFLANAAAAELSNLGEPTETRFGTVMIHLTQLFLRRGVRFKVGELGRQIADAASNRR